MASLAALQSSSDPKSTKPKLWKSKRKGCQTLNVATNHKATIVQSVCFTARLRQLPLVVGWCLFMSEFSLLLVRIHTPPLTGQRGAHEKNTAQVKSKAVRHYPFGAPVSRSVTTLAEMAPSKDSFSDSSVVSSDKPFTISVFVGPAWQKEPWNSRKSKSTTNTQAMMQLETLYPIICLHIHSHQGSDAYLSQSLVSVLSADCILV